MIHTLTNHPKIAYINGRWVRSFMLKLPKMSTKSLDSSLQHALADQFSVATQTMLLATSKQQKDGQLTIWAIEKDLYNQQIQTYNNARLTTLVPDYACLPFTPNHWTIAIIKQTCLLRFGLYLGANIPACNLQTTLDSLLRQCNKKPKQIDWPTHTAPPPALLTWCQHHGIRCQSLQRTFPDMNSIPPSMNLLDKKDQAASSFIPRTLKAPIGSLLACSCLTLATVIVCYFFQIKTYQTANNAILSAVTQYQHSRLPSPYRNMTINTLQQKLSQLLARNSSPFNQLIRVLGNALTKTKTATLQTLNFNHSTLLATIVLKRPTDKKVILSHLPKHNLLHSKITTKNGKTILQLTLEGLK